MTGLEYQTEESFWQGRKDHQRFKSGELHVAPLHVVSMGQAGFALGLR